MSPSKDDNENIWKLVKDTLLINCRAKLLTLMFDFCS